MTKKLLALTCINVALSMWVNPALGVLSRIDFVAKMTGKSAPLGKCAQRAGVFTLNQAHRPSPLNTARRSNNKYSLATLSTFQGDRHHDFCRRGLALWAAATLAGTVTIHSSDENPTKLSGVLTDSIRIIPADQYIFTADPLELNIFSVCFAYTERDQKGVPDTAGDNGRHTQHRLILVNEKLIGHCEYGWQHERGYIAWFGICGQQQKKGYGRTLLKYVIADMEAQGVQYIELGSSRASIPFYEKHGFVPRDEDSLAMIYHIPDVAQWWWLFSA